MKQIAIYGTGVISSSGENTFQPGLLQKTHSFKPLFDSPEELTLGAHIPGNVESKLLEMRAESKLLKHQDRVTLLATLVASAALREGLSRIHDGERAKDLLLKRTGVFAGTSRGGTSTLEAAIHEHEKRGRVPTLTSPVTTFGSVASTVAQYFNLHGPSGAFSATCTSGLSALFAASLLLESGRSESALVVGSEAPITSFTAAQMSALSVHATDWHLPFPCMPLAKERAAGSGLVLGEGASALLVGTHHSSRPQKPLALLSGISTSMDPTPTVTGISPGGLGLQRSMREAVEMAGGEVPCFIIAHAPGTLLGDKSELAAIKAVFGDNHPPVYSPKWLLGHTFGASGLISLALAIHLLQGETLPPPPYETEWSSFFPIHGASVRSILVNSSGFGGFTASAIVSRADL